MKVASIVLATVVISLSAIAQDALEPYVFILKGSDEAVYALVDPGDLKNGAYNVIIEEPWLRSTRVEMLRQRDVEEAYAEPPHTNSRRIKEGWKAHGGVEIETANGPQWVLQSELDLAQRSLDLAVEEQHVVATQAVETPIAVGEPAEQTAGIVQWWMHALVVVGALGASGLVVWWGFLKKDWSVV